jgi:ring-1,2-phenylacetyl-CoA epoxidase subunit PaaA
LEKLPSEYVELLGRVLTIQADCEIGGPHLYVKDVLLTAPSKVNQLIVARTAAEEMDHYRKIARVAGEIRIDVSRLLSILNQDRYLEAFRGTITTWEDYAVFGFLGRYL